MKLVFATHNQNKLIEVQQLLSNGIELLSLTDIGCTEEIPETATTLKENAQLKADYVIQNFGYDCFADDTGLEVQALNGAPGVYSARYAGPANDSELNIRKLLHNLEGESNRKAQFKSVIALNLKGEKHIFEGVCKGEILTQKRGEHGFGYDPIFKPIGFTGSFAEMKMEEKTAVSHRGRAIQLLISYLETL